MRRAVMLIIFLAGALLQSLLPEWPLFGGLRPPVVIALVIYYAFRVERRDMWLAVFWGALLYDSLEPGAFGPALLSFPLVGLAVHKVRNEVFADGIVTLLLFGMLGAGFVMLVTVIVYAVTGERPVSAGRVFGALVLGMVTMPVVNAVVRYAESGIPKRREIRWK